MRIVVTGASGNVGSAVLRRLAEEPGYDVTGIVRRPPLAGAGAPYDGVRWRAADLSNPASVPQVAGWLDGADAVVHLAWRIQPSHDRTAMRRTNVDGTRHLLDAMATAGVPALLYASSVGAYAPGPKTRLVDESWPVTGVAGSAYSEDKATVEALLDDAERADGDLRIVRFRQALVFQHRAGAEIVRYFLGGLVPTGLLRPGRLPVVPTDPRLRAQAVHADDLAEAYALALRSDVRGAFNIAAEPVLDPQVVAELLHARTVPVPALLLRLAAAATWLTRLQPTDPGWVDMAVASPLMDPARAHLELGWKPRRTATEALAELLAGMAARSAAPTPALHA
ncbi:NAD-dependent epimerase [Pilimelia terevasa]|uniref:NAD-dependent epimerase n=1 Tax=Pilimelia terevasa TaxID=53372 RepID=A0A8J3FFP8_9ACTN|nr:NAD-dependent epimerase/dehydratase family protein [Pilimelia terevasa]GGK21857.1 NAD-dependent epimerase [Pilimelia terevasa]